MTALTQARQDQRIAEAIHGLLAIYPRAEDHWIIQTVVEEFHFPEADVRAAFDARFRDHGVA